MKTKLAIILFLNFFASSNVLSEDNGLQRLHEMSLHTNQQLPKKLADTVTLDRTAVKDNTLQYFYYMDHFQAETFDKSYFDKVRPEAIKRSCTQGYPNPLAGGFNIEYRYYDKDSLYLGSVIIEPDHCDVLGDR